VLVNHFDQYFEVHRASTAADREAAFRLRFEVYCRDLGYEDAATFADGMERDGYDEQSEFVLLRHRQSNTFAGCVRVILGRSAPDRPFPFEGVCAGTLEPPLDGLDRRDSGEISRLAVHHEFRRRPGEWRSAAPADLGDDHGGARRHNLLPLGLFLSAAAIGLNEGLREVYVLMEPRLARLLSVCGLEFTQIGGLVDYHGPRGPFRIDRDMLQRGLRKDASELLDCLCDRLR
jgi:N-acyl amino acid synthase of PEP-CTERM/exosortase system